MCETAAAKIESNLKGQPEALAYWQRCLRGVDPQQLRALMDEVDDSDFGLLDWVEGLRALDQWLDARGLTLSLPDQIGYVSCSAAAAGGGGNLSHLPALVTDLLEAYGCDLAVKK